VSAAVVVVSPKPVVVASPVVVLDSVDAFELDSCAAVPPVEVSTSPADVLVVSAALLRAVVSSPD
jgi:hypothetical protein